MKLIRSIHVILILALSVRYASGEGESHRLCQVILQGQTTFSSEELNKRAGWNGSNTFSDAVIEAGIDRILGIYEDSGYPYCQIMVDSLSTESPDQIRLFLRISEGPLVKVNKVEFSGVSAGVARSLLKELRFESGEKFSASAWQERMRVLKNLEYIKCASGPDLKLDFSSGTATVSIGLEETKSSLSGGLGYVPARGTQSGYLAGNLSLNFSNFLGGPRQANLVWNKKNLDSYHLDFGFAEQWLFNSPFTFRLNFKQSQTDSSYSQISVEQQTSYRLGRHLTVASFLGRERVFQKGNLKNVFPSSRKTGLGIKLSFDHTDSRLNPRQGWDFFAQTKFFNWKKSDTLATAQTKNKDRIVENQFGLSKFIPTWEDQALMVKLFYARVSSKDGSLSPAELFRIGGTGTLRGYLQEQYWADRVFLTSLEYRFLLTQQDRFYLFTDMAYMAHNFFQNGDLVTEPDFRLGYGLGFWLTSRVGLVGLDLGLGQADQLNDLKVHLSVQNRF